MSKPTVDDYIKQGIYGPKEIKPEEKRLYLGTFRERVLIALTKRQVGQNEVNQEVEHLMQENREAHLFLNGHMNYSFLSKYIQKANAYGISYTMVTNKEYNSEYGLVFAKDYAIHKENILLEENADQTATQATKQTNQKDKKQPSSFFGRLFHKK